MSNVTEYKYFEQNIPLKKDMPSFKELKRKIIKLFHKKYFTSNCLYGKFVIKNIIYNEKTHIVAKFKDYLVIDDLSEFLKRFYNINESLTRLPLYFDYYHIYSRIFPNYTALKESKYIYKNIHRKQKMLDLQQEEESLEKKKEKEKEKEKKQIKHQRHKNKIDINTVFNNDVYNSIIKQSQDLYMVLFGIEKDKNDIQNSCSSFGITNIINLIEKYDYESKIGFNYKNNLIMPKISKNDNQKKFTKKDNNSSATTKQSTFNSSVIQQKMKKYINVHKTDKDIIIGLKKIKNEKKSITSNSLLIMPHLNKNILLNNHTKILTSYNYINTKENSKSKSIKKDNKKINKIRVNQKLLVDYNNEKYLTERSSTINKFKNIKINLDNNLNNTKKISNINNSRLRTNLINKKSIDFNWCSQLSIKNNTNTNIYKHKRINTNSNITESSKYKPYKIKLLNRAKAKYKLDFNSKLKLNLKEIRELIKNNKNIDKKCNTEREYIVSSYKFKNKDKEYLQQNIINEHNKTNILKRINNHKKSNPSIDLKTKINKNLLLSQKVFSSSKNNKLNIKTNFLPLPNFKINKNKIIQICNKKLTTNLDKIIDKNFCHTERESLQNSKKECLPEKIKYIIKNNFPILKNKETKYSKTTANSKNKDKLRINNKDKNDINKTILPFKKISREYKKIKRKEISPFEFSKYSLLNNTERNKKIINMKMILKLNNK